MLKKMVFVAIIMLQLLRPASALASFDVVDFGGTSMDLSSAMALVNHGIVGQLNPVKTLVNFSAHMADSGAPAQPTKNNNNRQRPAESALILSSAPDPVKTNSPMWPINGFAMIMAVLILFFLFGSGRGGIVLCRIQHLFARAREGICAISGPEYAVAGKFPLILNKVNGNFLFCETVAVILGGSHVLSNNFH